MKRPTNCGKDGVPCGRAIKGSELDKFDDSVPPEMKQCVQCWRALNSPEHQRLWGIASDDGGGAKVDVAALPKKSRPCC